jgi:pantoate--beta-alanine ligase
MLVKSPQAMSRLAQRWRRDGKSIGFVPTMGALHEGHLALVRAARRQDVAVVSLFVNPLQFGPKEDYARYPRTLARDLALLRPLGVHAVFVPTAAQMYPEGFDTTVAVAELGDRFEGAARPGHFRGVATVVAKLLAIVQPTHLYLGRKDYQQARLLSRMVADLRLPVRVRIRPTLRERDGLAMSSRNRYLSAEERAQAPAMYRALREAAGQLRRGAPSAAVERRARARIARQPAARVEYFSVADAGTLRPVAHPTGRIVVLAAVRVGATRLIDNILVDVP